MKEKNFQGLLKVTFLFVLLFLVWVVIFNYRRDILNTLSSRINKLSGNRLNHIYSSAYPHLIVENLWISYRNSLQGDGRTIDSSREYLTTSEGQSYSLLRAAWVDDKPTFDRVLLWTNHNLRVRETDRLFAWKWGRISENQWGILKDEGGLNTASDADQDIALALIFAYKRWKQPHYLTEAQQILNDIWNTEVLEVDGDYYMLAGNWAKSEEYPTINPSYLSFAAYPIFAEVDPSHPWMALKDTSYKVIQQATFNPLDKSKSAGIPPDWVALNPKTKEIIASKNAGQATNFSDDAFRSLWRVGLDWQWHQDTRARDYLNSISFIKNKWAEDKIIYHTYSHDGVKIDNYDDPSTYGGLIPYFEIVDPEAGREILMQKLVSLYNPDTVTFKDKQGYYQQNWVWFGIAFYEDKLLNIYQISN